MMDEIPRLESHFWAGLINASLIYLAVFLIFLLIRFFM